MADNEVVAAKGSSGEDATLRAYASIQSINEAERRSFEPSRRSRLNRGSNVYIRRSATSPRQDGECRA